MILVWFVMIVFYVLFGLLGFGFVVINCLLVFTFDFICPFGLLFVAGVGTINVFVLCCDAIFGGLF